MGVIDTIKKYDTKLKKTALNMSEKKAQRLEKKAEYYRKLGANRSRIAQAKATIDNNSFMGKLKKKTTPVVRRASKRMGKDHKPNFDYIIGSSSKGKKKEFKLM